MKINTRTVKELGQLTIRADISPQEIDSNPPFGVSYPKPFSCLVQADALDKKEVLIQGQLQGQTRLTCSRCLEEFDQTLSVPFELVAPLNEGELDLSGEVTQAVVLALPMKPLCRDRCKGLCPRCGQNLNNASCGCKPEVVHPGLETFKNLKITR